MSQPRNWKRWFSYILEEMMEKVELSEECSCNQSWWICAKTCDHFANIDNLEFGNLHQQYPTEKGFETVMTPEEEEEYEELKYTDALHPEYVGQSYFFGDSDDNEVISEHERCTSRFQVCNPHADHDFTAHYRYD